MFHCPTNALQYINLLNFYKPIKLLKVFATCFGSCRKNHQEATTNAWLNLQSCPKLRVGADVVSVMAAYS
jgi:hypothetical protein